MEIGERPWGKYEVLAESNGYKVKRITVSPQGRLSLQSHEHRAEHWVVVTGTAKVTVDEDIMFANPGDSVYVPLGAIHRLENEAESDMVLIEVQTGTYLGEDMKISMDVSANKAANFCQRKSAYNPRRLCFLVS